MRARFALRILALGTVAACASVPFSVSAQSLDGGEEQAASGSHSEIQPYIEAAQVLTAELSPGNDLLTYTRLAAGVDTTLAGRNSAASASLRYERRIGYGEVADSDSITGIARASMGIVPRRLAFEVGALAARNHVEGGGATVNGFDIDDSSTSRLYSVYAGPALQANVGDLAVTGAYQLGYTRLEEPDAPAISTPGGETVDLFDESVTQQANIRAGFAPGTALPVGVGVGAGWNRQDISNLDQRLDDRHVRADVTVPVSRTLALVGGVGYEDVEVSSRDALRDVDGDPVIGSDGRLVTDKSAPRQIAYQTDGLIWDAGVMWRPSRRTSLQATVGRRYDSTTYTGALNYTPNERTSLNVSVYDNVTGFGGVLTDRLADLSTDFEAFRNPITGDLTQCVDSLDGGNCVLGSLGSLRSAIFRSRGVTASLGRNTGRTSYGLAGGYDRRKYIAAAGTALAAADGLVDENVWLGAYARQQLDQQSGISANAYVNWFDSGFDLAGNGTGYSATIAYYRELIRGLSGTAAVGVDGVIRDDVPDYSNASALVGLRYSF